MDARSRAAANMEALLDAVDAAARMKALLDAVDKAKPEHVPEPPEAMLQRHTANLNKATQAVEDAVGSPEHGSLVLLLEIMQQHFLDETWDNRAFWSLVEEKLVQQGDDDGLRRLRQLRGTKIITNELRF